MRNPLHGLRRNGQPHTVRGVISGVLRKRLGLNVACSSPDQAGIRTYRIVDAA